MIDRNIQAEVGRVARDEAERASSGRISADTPFLLFGCSTVILFVMVFSVSGAFWILLGLDWYTWLLFSSFMFLMVWSVVLLYPMFQTTRDTTLSIVEDIAHVVSARVEIARAIADAAKGQVSYEGDDIRMIPVGGGIKRLRRPAISLPNGEIIEREDFLDFLRGAIHEKRGIGRDTWSPPMRREVYDGVIDLMSRMGAIEGRKAGYMGRLSVTYPEAIEMFGLEDV